MSNKRNLFDELMEGIDTIHEQRRRKITLRTQYCYIMALMDIFAHLSILRRKRRGIEPEGIQFAF